MATLRCVLLLWAALLSAAQDCRREPPGRTQPNSVEGNGFRIKLNGNPRHYNPGQIYTVKLMGWRTQYLAEKFTAFNLVVQNTRTGSASVREAGSFQLFDFGLAKLDPRCPNMVSQTSTALKTEIEVLWMAPPPGAGCVTFKAVVVRSRYVWYMDDGGLTKELCEAPPSGRRRHERPQQEEGRSGQHGCCACDEAKYEMKFEGLWSRETHPRDYPKNEWLMHFSDVLVASHTPNVTMWEEGSTASDGLKQVAEWGYTRKLEQELKKQGRAIRSLTRAKGLWHPNVQGSTSADFRVDKKRHVVSVVTMLGPSPDWILGVPSQDLCLPDCTWLERKIFDLRLFDAGTDSGITYEAPNEPTSPREPVRAITASWPADPRAPFYSPSGGEVPPLARVTLTRSRVIPRGCDQHGSNDDSLSSDEGETEPEDNRPECMVTPWSDWSECSVTCGEGLSMRTREYKLPIKAAMMECKQQLVEKVLCDAPLTCDGRPSASYDSADLTGEGGVCAMTPWSAWSQCSVTCGEGDRMRRRTYLDRMGRKKCFHDTVEKEKCFGVQAECPDTNEVDTGCPTSGWSDWSPCSVTCGQGQRVRARLLLVPEQLRHQCSAVQLMEKGHCVADRPDCTLTMQEAKKVCMMEKDEGDCRGYFPRYYYEPRKGMCIQFIYGGCRGNMNNFEDFETCQDTCSVVDSSNAIDTGPSGDDALGPAPAPAAPDGPPVDCMVTPWGPWSACSATCGRARQQKSRMIKVEPRNGGRPCPRRLLRYRRCRHLPPCF